MAASLPLGQKEVEMKRLHKTFCGFFFCLTLLSCPTTNVLAEECSVLVEFFSEEGKTLHTLFPLKALDCRLKAKIELGEFPKDKLNKEGTAFKEDWKFCPEEAQKIQLKLAKELEAQKDNGQKYLLPKDTLFTTPTDYCVTIPKGTAVVKEADQTPANYKLSNEITAKIEFPENIRVSLDLLPESRVERILRSSGPGTTLTVEPRRAPRGGYVTLVLENKAFDFSKARFFVCLREQYTNPSTNPFFPSEDVQLEKLANQGYKATLRARVPKMTGISGVHFAKPVDLLVVARAEDGTTLEMVFKEFRVSSRGLAIIFWALAFIIPWWVAGFVVSKKTGQTGIHRFNPIWFVSGKYGDASLSLAQSLLWTILVFSASFYVLVVSGKLLDLTPDVLTLLGIAGGSSVLAKIAASVKDEEGREILNGEKNRMQIVPSWLDLFRSEGRPDLYKFQMALFTTLAAFFVIGKIFKTVQFPELPAGLLTLIGISNGVYLTAKSSSRTMYEKLADKNKKFKEAEEEARKRTKEAEETEKLYKNAKQENDKIQVDNTADKAMKEEAFKRFEEAERKKKLANAAKAVTEEKAANLKTDLEKLKKDALHRVDVSKLQQE